jgi:hypothetical protein
MKPNPGPNQKINTTKKQIDDSLRRLQENIKVRVKKVWCVVIVARTLFVR